MYHDLSSPQPSLPLKRAIGDAAGLHAVHRDPLRGIADLTRGQKAIYECLNTAQQQLVDEVLAGVREMRLEDAESAREMRAVLDGIRRELIELQVGQLPELSAEVRRALDEVTEVVRAGTDVKTGLELAIPLVPALLHYNLNVDLGGGLDLRTWWESLPANQRESWVAERRTNPTPTRRQHAQLERTTPLRSRSWSG